MFFKEAMKTKKEKLVVSKGVSYDKIDVHHGEVCPCQCASLGVDEPLVAFLFLVAMPGAPSRVLAPSSKARSP